METRSTIRTNTTKAKLAEGKVVFGAIINRYAPDLVERWRERHGTIRRGTGAWRVGGPMITASG